MCVCMCDCGDRFFLFFFKYHYSCSESRQLGACCAACWFLMLLRCVVESRGFSYSRARNRHNAHLLTSIDGL